MKVFVTSATGYIGAEIAKLLLAEGHTVGEQLRLTLLRRLMTCPTSTGCVISRASVLTMMPILRMLKTPHLSVAPARRNRNRFCAVQLLWHGLKRVLGSFKH